MSADLGLGHRVTRIRIRYRSHTSSLLIGVIMGAMGTWWVANYLHLRTLLRIEAQVERIEALADECEEKVAEVVMGRRKP